MCPNQLALEPPERTWRDVFLSLCSMPGPHFSSLPTVRGVLQTVPVALLPQSGAALSYTEGEGPASIWPDGVPPDGTPIEVEHFPYPAVMGVVYTYCCLGVLFAISCLIFNIAYRKRK